MCCRWFDIADQLQEKVAEYETLIACWDKYNADLQALTAHVEDKEQGAHGVLLAASQPDRPDNSLKTVQALQTEVQDLLQSLAQLEQNSEKITSHLDPTSQFQFTSQQSQLRHKLQTMLHDLDSSAKQLQADSDKYKQFKKSYKLLDGFLTQAADTLKAEDPNKSAEEEQLRPRLEQLKDLSVQFSQHSPEYNRLNDLGRYLPLSEADARRLETVNDRWQQLYNDVNQRCKALQSHLLLQQDFHSKCEQWLIFLAQVEKALSADIATTYDGLLDQQRAFEVCTKYRVFMETLCA